MKKDNNTQDLIEKYIYDTIRRLPPSQRQDIEMELRSIIDDMLESSQEETVEDILKKLGTPSELARKYRGSENYLIGPEYYEQYCFVLKIVLICSMVGMVIGGIINFITNIGGFGMSLADIIEQVIHGITEPIISLGAAFSIVTIIFAILEHQKVKVDISNEKNWTPSQIPEVPSKKALLSRGEVATELVFTIILFGILAFAPQLMGAWVKEGEHYRAIPIFNLEIWAVVFPFFITWFVLSLVDSIVKLVVGRYGITVAITNAITGFLSFGITVIIFKYFPIWNPNFVRDIEAVFQQNVSSKADILNYWGSDLTSNIFLGIVFLAILIDMGTTLYKSIRYGNYLKDKNGTNY